MNQCRLSESDRARIDALGERLRRSIKDTQPQHLGISRAALLRGLLRQGLDLVKTREIEANRISREERLVVLSFRIGADDSARLDELRHTLKARSPLSELPQVAELERAILRMAIAEAETRASFPRFVRAALDSRLPSRTRA
jgi:hypothetical protein